MISSEQISEQQKCPECNSNLYYPEPENCYCHINPPCSACTDIVLICEKCEWENEE